MQRVSPPLKNMVLLSYISGLQIGVISTDNTLLNRLKDKILSKKNLNYCIYLKNLKSGAICELKIDLVIFNDFS